jgi:glycosyltransferase involved in cell wall biosynthesis
VKFSLIIPLWNEQDNIEKLVELINENNLVSNGMHELILVNNGSTDKTATVIDQVRSKYSWIKVVDLENNLNYGGGINEGFKHASTEILCYIPGDLQVLPDDVRRVYELFVEKSNFNKAILVKGLRIERHDGLQNTLVSKAYTFLANSILGINVSDANGLPKMFNKSLLDCLPVERAKNFVFDTQILYAARSNGWEIYEIPVVFHSRRTGISSWSGKRVKTYLEVFSMLIRMRKSGSISKK